jgi:hypothetical protein
MVYFFCKSIVKTIKTIQNAGNALFWYSAWRCFASAFAKTMADEKGYGISRGKQIFRQAQYDREEIETKTAIFSDSRFMLLIRYYF